MKIAGIQFACSADKDSNTEKALEVLELAVKEGAKIVCFQELFNLQWFPKDRDKSAFGLADTIRGDVVAAFRERAKRHNVVVLLPIFERHHSRYYNSCIVIGSTGKIIGIYRKVHIPDIPLWEERYYFSTADKGIDVFETDYCRIGIQISWDNLYPEGARILALKGADIIFSPTACAFKSQHIWQSVITGNAITNCVFIMRVNRVGSEDIHDFYGMSFCVNPEGELIGGPTGRGDSILLADIDLDYLKEVRREWPILQGRMPAFYKDILS
ncbi:MAG TPA: nitrilase-related carbon-nitrogen hydrolase [Syntrophorhabdaceae bacterium]|nr:nitrilase-related carbon-nitrogen hydrolase [Syntrophorhabdaceae bacterium]HOL06322.1 nitrilase-related carbon-nitrogen hydrolase [Syntrophorhabdaceae bacterium]HON86088.1 nitrilase-related carbon-nitrogen hydrolase [Syntrophorhabdaceae bacterium]HOT42338.1 nitrilase-related carbon-nitrogen hydrolase [Syntrophorhabdaceae bacterium]HPC67397.1 nitrilase-related carbon-nitrogen hydrolase [Syntrophorhabdaceae bacterium]